MKHLPRSQETVNRNLRDRVRNLERGAPFNPRPQSLEVAVFSAPPDVAPPEALSGNYLVVIGGQIVGVTVTLVTAGTTGSTFQLYRNGSTVGSTFTITASDVAESFYVGDVRMAAGDRLQVETTSAGTDAAGPTVQVRMKG